MMNECGSLCTAVPKDWSLFKKWLTSQTVKQQAFVTITGIITSIYSELEKEDNIAAMEFKKHLQKLFADDSEIWKITESGGKSNETLP